MNSQQAAKELLQRLDLPQDTANVAINDSTRPSEFTVLVFSPERPIARIDTWMGHPVKIIFTGGNPSPQ